MLTATTPSPVASWKRINMRSVAHLLAVEFMHDLYSRYEPTINAIRFRHTRTIWKDGIVNAYAPVEDWDRIGKVLGQQFYDLDPTLLLHVRRLYARDRQYFHDFMARLAATDLQSLSFEALASLLVSFQSLVLGELYVLNFVQVEHGLNTAIRRILVEAHGEQSVDALLAQLIETDLPTASQREKQALYRIARKWQVLRRLGLYNPTRARREVLEHGERYQHLYSAYGEDPRPLEEFWGEFLQFFEGVARPAQLPFRPQVMNAASRKALRRLANSKLDVLVPLLVEGGHFRDTNKALLGQSTRYRFAMLDEIARRGLEGRSELNYYLLSEVVLLLHEGKRVGRALLAERRHEGVMLERSEDVSIPVVSAKDSAKENESPTLRGVCASPGVREGVCRVILHKSDADRVEEGDIMVAIGTDFDLIEAMYRAAAVVTEEGGILSHASVVCRELKKPCCIGVKSALQQLREGQRIRVDATNGTISVIA